MKEAGALYSIFFLPLREKVSAEPTDEGCRRRSFDAGFGQLSEALIGRHGVDTPHPTRFAGHLLPQGEKGFGAT
jgi:hypothetical protein